MSNSLLFKISLVPVLAWIGQRIGLLDRVADATRDDNRDGLPDLGNLFADRLSIEQVYALARDTVEHFNMRVPVWMVVTIASIESSFRPEAFRNEPSINDASYGLMQTLYGTAKWLHDTVGYRGITLNAEAQLFDARVSMYFGAAYLDYLMRRFPSANDGAIARKYNGGPAGDSKDATLPYLKKYISRKADILQTLAEKGII